MPDRYVTNPNSAAVPEKWFAVTPSDTVDFTLVARAIYVGGAGNVTVVNEDSTTALFTAPPVGTIIPGRFRRVNATNTTATLLVAGY